MPSKKQVKQTENSNTIEVKEEQLPSQEVKEVKQEVKPVKEKRPRTEKQILAVRKMREALASKKQQAKQEPAPQETEPIQNEVIHRKETIDEPQPVKVERKEIKKEIKHTEEEQDNTFNNWDYDAIFSPQQAQQPTHIRVGHNTYSVQALKSYKNSLQYRKSHMPPSTINKSIFY